MNGSVTLKFCLQKKKRQQGLPRQHTLEKCFRKPVWHFLFFNMPTFPLQPSEKMIFFSFLLFKFPLFMLKLNMCIETGEWKYTLSLLHQPSGTEKHAA